MASTLLPSRGGKVQIHAPSEVKISEIIEEVRRRCAGKKTTFPIVAEILKESGVQDVSRRSELWLKIQVILHGETGCDVVGYSTPAHSSAPGKVKDWDRIDRMHTAHLRRYETERDD